MSACGHVPCEPASLESAKIPGKADWKALGACIKWTAQATYNTHQSLEKLSDRSTSGVRQLREFNLTSMYETLPSSTTIVIAIRGAPKLMRIRFTFCFVFRRTELRIVATKSPPLRNRIQIAVLSSTDHISLIPRYPQLTRSVSDATTEKCRGLRFLRSWSVYAPISNGVGLRTNAPSREQLCPLWVLLAETYNLRKSLRWTIQSMQLRLYYIMMFKTLRNSWRRR